MEITDLKKSIIVSSVVILILILVVYCDSALGSKNTSSQSYITQKPVKNHVYIYDKANILGDIKESTGRYLEIFKKDYAVEAVIVTIPVLPSTHTIESLAVELFSNWRIGKNTGGRGILLLLADKEKLIKIEVSYELEDVFTDIFCGYIEDKQLRAYFLNNQLEIGLVAVLEEIEQRAQLKHRERYSLTDINQLDQELLSGGAGAKRQLSDYQEEKISRIGQDYPAGRTPDEAWQTLIRSWEHKVRDPNLGVYTEITRLAYRDFKNLPDSRYEEDVLTYKNKPYEIIQNDTHAVIFFGKKKGWENAPFLFCRKNDGWQFNIVHQRKYIRMGKNPHWGVERSSHPYGDLLARCPYWMNQDIPLEGDDIYRIEDDHRLAQEIIKLESAYEEDPDDFRTVIQLGKLYTITSLSPKKRIAFLKKARQINPGNPEPYKYLGIVHLDAFYQFESAIKEMSAYVEQRPDDVFGHNYLGYLYYCEQKYHKAIREFNRSIELKPDNCYAFAKLSRTYAGLYLQSSTLDPRRIFYRKKAVGMFAKASATATPEPRRIKWLERYLVKNEILDR
jgi:tetratricopeptide (TPR) repeat protein